ncbi:MAG: DNA processing protein [Ignavibacteria bacterium]|nr:MAG: DNA processing protein [Ignavibacteria bacterium]KAF0159875.1 MAG: DNA processing protein [Ignavibacteria bacterium]
MEQEKVQQLVSLKQLYSIEGIGPQKIFSLLSQFKTIEKIFDASQHKLLEVEGINKQLSAKILRSSENRDKVVSELDKELSSLEKLNARLISYFDGEYPEILKNIYFPPIFLYVKGNFHQADINSVAIVGTREPSNYGKTVAENFSRGLAEKGITTVSGLARGIDTIVHQSTLKANGRTIAVIGSGLDIVYPSENRKLFQEVTEKGLIISEYPLGTKPDSQNFPRRNRIISGLSLGTVVVETRINGGALNTANYALDQGREVFAVPGMISSRASEGPNALIQKGNAKLVIRVEDILDELRIKFDGKNGRAKNSTIVQLNLFEEKIYDVLKDGEKQIDEISQLSGLSTSDCLVHLLSMEFKSIVRQLPGKVFTID